MDAKKIISFIRQEDDIEETLLAKRPTSEKLKLLKDVKDFMQYIGYAGEFRVMSELLIRGVNALNGRVDEGFDITAIKDDEIFLVQVKTAFLNRENCYSFNISAGSEAQYKGAHKTAYVFVLISGAGENSGEDRTDFLVLSGEELERQKKAGNVWFIESTKRYRMKIYLRDGRASVGKQENDMSRYLNSWSFFIGGGNGDKKAMA